MSLPSTTVTQEPPPSVLRNMSPNRVAARTRGPSAAMARMSIPSMGRPRGAQGEGRGVEPGDEAAQRRPGEAAVGGLVGVVDTGAAAGRIGHVVLQAVPGHRVE